MVRREERRKKRRNCKEFKRLLAILIAVVIVFSGFAIYSAVPSHAFQKAKNSTKEVSCGYSTVAALKVAFNKTLEKDGVKPIETFVKCSYSTNRGFSMKYHVLTEDKYLIFSVESPGSRRVAQLLYENKNPLEYGFDPEEIKDLPYYVENYSILLDPNYP